MKILDVALISNNAKVGADIAVELSKLRRGTREERKLPDIASPVSTSR